MIHRILFSCLALLVWASPATAGPFLNNETYQFTLKYFETVPAGSFVNTVGNITLTFSASISDYIGPGHAADGSLNTGFDQILENAGGALTIKADSSDPQPCTYIGPDVPLGPIVSHDCPFQGTSQAFGADFTGEFKNQFVLQLTSTDLCGCEISGFLFDQQLYVPTADGGYFNTGTFNFGGSGIGTLTITAIDPTSGGGSDPTVPDPTIPDPTMPGTSAVPEPASWALMVGGLGLIGATRRRQKRAAA